VLNGLQRQSGLAAFIGYSRWYIRQSLGCRRDRHRICGWPHSRSGIRFE
jgi:hypothetical protein